MKTANVVFLQALTFGVALSMAPPLRAQSSPTPENTPSLTASPRPLPGISPLPGSTVKPRKFGESGSETPLRGEIKKHCARHYSGKIQGDLRLACASSTETFEKFGLSLAMTQCRVNFGLEPRAAMACLIGVTIAKDLSEKKEEFIKKLQSCAELYPQHTEIDAFLQESCLTGVHLPEVAAGNDKKGFEACAQVSAERSFIGPCAVGLSFIEQPQDASSANKQNLLCEQYFDHRRFHLTYRACLNARSIFLKDDASVTDNMLRCSEILADPSNDNERAACLVGSSIHRSLTRGEEINKKFQKCGDTKVSYQDRDVLACLSASSIVELNSRGRGESGCKEVFKSGKNSSRGDCINSLELF